MENKKMTVCKTCGAEIAKNARTCPKCGAKRKKGLTFLIILLIVVALIIVIGSIGANSGKPKKVDTVAAAAQDIPANTDAPVTASDAPASSELEQAVKDGVQEGMQDASEALSVSGERFSVGDVVELNNVKVTLVEVRTVEDSDYSKPEEGNVFLLCEFDIANGSSEDVDVSSMMSFEAYCDDYACSTSFSALVAKGNSNQLDGTIAAGKKMNGVVGYEVPADWKELEIHFTPDFWSGKDIVFVANH